MWHNLQVSNTENSVPYPELKSIMYQSWAKPLVPQSISTATISAAMDRQTLSHRLTFFCLIAKGLSCLQSIYPNGLNYFPPLPRETPVFVPPTGFLRNAL